MDEAADTTAMKYDDGAVEEYDMETWRMLETVPIAASEDWSAPFDEVEKDELGYSDGTRTEDHANPLDQIDRMD